MQIVIDIPEEIYNYIHNEHIAIRVRDAHKIADAIANGVLLSKGHGKLKDVDEIAKNLEILRDSLYNYRNEYEFGKYEGYDYSLEEVMDAHTIIEADPL